MKERVTLNKKEQTRLVVLNQIKRGEMTGKEIAQILDLSLRHERRILACVQKVTEHGVPYALYHDRHGIFERSRKETETIEESLAEEANTVWPADGRVGYYFYFFTLIPGKGKD